MGRTKLDEWRPTGQCTDEQRLSFAKFTRNALDMARKNRGVTFNEFAKEIHVDPRTLDRFILAGMAAPSPLLIQRIEFAKEKEIMRISS